jgi:hypothetical protein
MLDDDTKQRLRKELEAEVEALRAAGAARASLDSQITDHKERIAALRKLLDETALGDLHDGMVEDSVMRVKPRLPRKGSRTDEIRLLLEAEPLITAKEVIDRIRSKFPESKIDYHSFWIWDRYFKEGRYLMDRDKYRIRYRQERPY